MEFIKGKSLKQLLNEVQSLSVSEAIEVTAQLSSALQHIHQAGIVHRDIKPANILITNTPAPNTPIIIDFGLARTPDSSNQKLTSTGELIGTPEYMSPEQATGRPVTKQSDLYSLTLCFFQMLSGKTPFHADNALGILYKQSNEPVPDLQIETSSALAQRLNYFVKIGLSKEPMQRFLSAELFSNELLEIASIAAHSPRDRKPAILQAVNTSKPSSGIFWLLGSVLMIGILILVTVVASQPRSPKPNSVKLNKKSKNDVKSRLSRYIFMSKSRGDYFGDAYRFSELLLNDDYKQLPADDQTILFKTLGDSLNLAGYPSRAQEAYRKQIEISLEKSTKTSESKSKSQIDLANYGSLLSAAEIELRRSQLSKTENTLKSASRLIPEISSTERETLRKTERELILRLQRKKDALHFNKSKQDGPRALPKDVENWLLGPKAQQNDLLQASQLCRRYGYLETSKSIATSLSGEFERDAERAIIALEEKSNSAQLKLTSLTQRNNQKRISWNPRECEQLSTACAAASLPRQALFFLAKADPELTSARQKFSRKLKNATFEDWGRISENFDYEPFSLCAELVPSNLSDEQKVAILSRISKRIKTELSTCEETLCLAYLLKNPNRIPESKLPDTAIDVYSVLYTGYIPHTSNAKMETVLSRATQFSPNKTIAINLMLYHYMETGQYTKALEILDRVKPHVPEDLEYGILLEQWFELGLPAKALDRFNSYPHNIAQDYLMFVEMCKYHNEMDMALQELGEGLSKLGAKERASLQLKQAEILIENNELKEASQSLMKLYNMKQDFRELKFENHEYQRLALALLLTGQKQRSEEVYTFINDN